MLSPRGNVIRLLRHAVRVRYGSFSTGTRPAAGSAMSAVAPKAEVRVLEFASTGRSGLMMPPSA